MAGSFPLLWASRSIGKLSVPSRMKRRSTPFSQIKFFKWSRAFGSRDVTSASSTISNTSPR
jgi:hypothetical protein